MRNTTQKKTRLSLIALAMSTVFLLPGVAGAADVCHDDMLKVETAIINANFTGRHPLMDRDNMLRKHLFAGAKLSLGKFDDAINKLMDISEKASALAGDGSGRTKPKLTDATVIYNAVDDAIACIAPR